MLWRFIGFWVVKRAYRLLTADDARPLQARLTREAKRVLVGAAITVAVLLVAAIFLTVLLIAAVT